MEPIEIVKFLSIPISIAFAGLWLSKSINNLAESLDGASTDNYEIALRLTKLIHSDQSFQNSSDKAGIEREYIETYSRVLQKAAEIDYMVKDR
ncbi:MAG: hypothetical protein ACRBHB_01855 [Arenicella sp.]